MRRRDLRLRGVADVREALDRLTEVVEMHHGDQETRPAVLLVAFRGFRQRVERGLLELRLVGRSLPVVMQDRPERVLPGGGLARRLARDERDSVVAREVVQAGVEPRRADRQPRLHVTDRSRQRREGPAEAQHESLAPVAHRAQTPRGGGVVVDEAAALRPPLAAVESDVRCHGHPLRRDRVRRHLDGRGGRAGGRGARGERGVASDPHRATAVLEGGDLADGQDRQRVRRGDAGSEGEEQERDGTRPHGGRRTEPYPPGVTTVNETGGLRAGRPAARPRGRDGAGR